MPESLEALAVVDCLEGERAGASICVTPLIELSRGQITRRPLPILG
jgi:hypothetical protein